LLAGEDALHNLAISIKFFERVLNPDVAGLEEAV
jgi:hypothetical protein